MADDNTAAYQIPPARKRGRPPLPESERNRRRELRKRKQSQTRRNVYLTYSTYERLTKYRQILGFDSYGDVIEYLLDR